MPRPPELYLLQGRSLLAVQRFQDAMVAFSRAQALDPDRAETYTNGPPAWRAWESVTWPSWTANWPP